jgi:hypothetical protein
MYAELLIQRGALVPVARYGGGCGGGREDAADFACDALAKLLQVLPPRWAFAHLV